jgi:hypothetical protein
VAAVPDFGHVMIGRNNSYTVEVRNVSRAPLNITQVDIDVPMEDYQIQGTATGHLESSQSLHFNIVFAPLVVGSRVTNIVFHDDGEEQTTTEKLSGVGILGEATFAPQSLNFGDVGVGSSSSLGVTFTNTSTVDPASVNISASQGPDAASFGVSSIGNLDVAPGGTLTIQVTFRPESMGPHVASMVVTPCPSCTPQTVPMTGNGIAADLTALPSPLAFGYVLPLTTVMQTVTVTNLGTRAATISPVTFESGSSSAFTVAPTGTVVLAQNQTLAVTVSFTPPQTGTYQGALRIPTDDTGTPVMIVPLSGSGGGPSITVNPNPLGFPETAVGLSVEKQISIGDEGSGPTAQLILSSVTITAGRFTVQAPLPGTTIDNGHEVDIPVTYTPTVAGSDTATVTIQSNDPLHPTIQVPITGSAEVLPPCTFADRPPSLNFGSVATGTTVQLYFEIQNQGASPCAVADINLSPTTPNVFAMSYISTRIIDVGGVLEVPVEFSPTGPGDWTGDVVFDVASGVTPTGTVPLNGSGVPACFSLQPNPLNFGSVGLSCTAPTLSEQATNNCATTVTIQQSYIGVAPSTAFSLAPASAGTVTLAPGAQALLPVTYAPTAAGTDQGVLYVQTDFATAPYSVPLVGEAVGQETNTDTYTLPPVQQVDVLWVVDNSGSMSNKQAELSANAGTFIQTALNSGIDFHIAVTTTGITPFSGGIAVCPGGANGGEAGRFFPVDDSSPRILTPTTPNVAQVFSQDVLVGICHYIEEGFTAMEDALSPPLITEAKDPGTPWPADGNAGFLRPAARLYVIWVTDEDDMVPDPNSPIGKSPNPVPVQDYVNFLYSLKPGRPDLVSASAAIAQPSSCGGNYDGVGLRYMSLVGELGGDIADICSPDWNGVITDFANAAFAPQLDFPLTEAPAGRTVTVTVNGVTVPATGANGQVNWQFNPAVGNYGAVVFNTNDAPGPSSTVTITYPVPCPASP